ncbi:MAG: DUF3306 domain-containing protein, partial [Pseudomonadota bacterium]
MAHDTRDDEDVGFLTRWSRRKLEDAAPPDAAADAEGGRTTAPPQSSDGVEAVGVSEGAADDSAEANTEDHEAEIDQCEDVDFDTLDYQSDYTRFMGKNVPEDVRNRALEKLWSSDPILANVDGLTDYSDDFTDAALAVPRGMLRTAYKVGQGFLSDAEVAEWEALGRDTDPSTAQTDDGAGDGVATPVTAGAGAGRESRP